MRTNIERTRVRLCFCQVVMLREMDGLGEGLTQLRILLESDYITRSYTEAV